VADERFFNDTVRVASRKSLYQTGVVMLHLLILVCLLVVEDGSSELEPGIAFDLGRLSIVPKVTPVETVVADGAVAPSLSTPEDSANLGVKAIFYEGLDYNGQPTKVFAYCGIPKPLGEGSLASKLPGVVLVHGGGGTAFASWVKLWNDRGYAAIAMDLCGCVPVGTYGNWQRHPLGGPPGWDASFEQIDGPLEDQWQMHAVSAVIRANSLLRSFAEVDADRIGLTGISWGGYMTCLVAGVDSRFRCAVPVYGCGFLGDNSAWLTSFEKLGETKAQKWQRQWDPSVYLPRAKMPFLWVNGTNDFAYPMDSWQRSIHLQSPHSMCLRIGMPHGHGPAGENPEEIRVFMDSILQNGKPLPEVLGIERVGSQVSARYHSTVKIKSGELCFTRDIGAWQERKWESIPADLNAGSSFTSIVANLPQTATVWYINVTDEGDCVVSTEHHFSVDDSAKQ
jgi:dienelactone hydrolase